MSKQKKFFFKKEENVIKELLSNEKMQYIFGGLEQEYTKTTYAESTAYGKGPVIKDLK